MSLSAPTTTMSSTSKDQISSKFHIRNNNSSNDKNNNNDNDDDDDDNYPTSKCIPFPYPTGPYLQQAALMDALLDGIPRQRRQRSVAHLVVDEDINVENKNGSGGGGDGSVKDDEQKQNRTTRILALESPTGTGKSLSLACAGLAWLEYEESLYYNNKKNEGNVDVDVDVDVDVEAEDINVYDPNHPNKKSTVISPIIAVSDRTTTTVTATTATGIDWLDSWQPPTSQDDDNGRKREQNSQKYDKERHQKLLQKLDELRNQLQSPPSKQYHQQHQRQSQHQQQRHRERRENILRMALTKSRMDEKKRLRNNIKKRKRSNNNRTSMMSKITLAYEDDDDDVDDKNDDSSYCDLSDKYNNSKRKIKKKNFIPGTAEWLLQRQQQQLSQQRQQQQNSSSQCPVAEVARPPQILYAARTHSQLSQFVQEIRKTKWGKTLRVVALGSRGQGLCGELTTKTLNSNNDNDITGITTKKKKNLVVVPENRLTETCLELRKNHNASTTNNSNNKNNSTDKKCSHYVNDESVATLAIHGLVEATDLEDLAKLGKVNKTCAYYATRMSIPVAQLIVLPYSLLCSTKSRNALGLTLHYNTLVLVDEAHNLPNAISNLNSATVTKSTTMSAQSQLDNYLNRYVDKLSSLHLRLLGQLKLLIRGLITSMTTGDNQNKKKKRRNHTINAITTTTTTQLGKQELSEHQKQRYLLSSSQFLVSQRLETINLFPVLRYMDESKLSQKLLGFMTPTSSSSTLKAEGKMKNYDVDDYDDSNGNKSNDIAAVTTNSCHISPMSIVETFLEKLTYANDNDGQVVVDKGTAEYDEGRGNTGTGVSTANTVADRVSSHEKKEPQLRFCVLNPAVQARDELWASPRAVALVGGTLQPLDVMMRELIPGKVATHAANAQSMWTNDQQQQRTITSVTNNTRNPYLNNRRIAKTAHTTIPSTKIMKGGESVVLETDEPAASMTTSNHHRLYRSNDFWAFTCGHVVDPSRVLLQSLTKVHNVTIDVRHKTRSTQAVTTAIGKALVRICQSVPHGVVVFLPSYKYEAILVNAWKKHSSRNNDKNTANMSTAANDKTIWIQLEEATTVIREPKQASQVESTLNRYARNATKSSRGALLLSVVGGKLSEGINFADDLCRCVVVVGLPFADLSDPLLQEKLKLVANSSGNISSSSSSNCNIKSTAAQNYYRSLCLRAVNQSVGRAIRHAKDQATIVLMDARYPVDEAIARGLPSWLTESTPSWRRESTDLNSVIRRTEDFFATL